MTTCEPAMATDRTRIGPGLSRSQIRDVIHGAQVMGQLPFLLTFLRNLLRNAADPAGGMTPDELRKVCTVVAEGIDHVIEVGTTEDHPC